MAAAILGDVLRDLLRDPKTHDWDIVMYVPEAMDEVTLFTPVLLLQHPSYDDDTAGHRYLLEASIAARIIEGLRAELGATPTLPQCLRAVLYYAENDAPAPLDLIV